MSFLDLYQGDQAAAMKPQPGEANDLPATFGETFEKAWNYGRLFGQSVSGENARGDALQDYIDDVHTKTGENIASKIDWSGMAMGGALPASMLLDQANDAVKQINAKNPNAQIEPIDQDELERRAVAKSRQAGVDLADVAGRETTFGGKLGLLAGGLGSAATDPVNLLALPIAPETEGVSLLAAGLRWGAVAAGSQAVIEAAGAPYREEVQPGYATSGAPFANIAEAGAGGAVLGAGTRALGNLWTRMKTGTWPTSIRDAGNVVESEANVANTNVYLGAEGEAAHWEAMNFSIDSVLNERPVDVTDIITPNLEAQSRSLIVRLQGERAAALPAFDQRSVALLSEEAGLRSRDAELSNGLEGLGEGNPTSADRLNRLQAVEQQITQAQGDARKQLLERRDQILVDTTPEQLRAEAAPIEQRRQIEAERQQIATRLSEIDNERAKSRAAALGTSPAMVGQMEPVRPIPIEDLRRMAGASADLATTERAAVTGEAPELPFAASAAEGHAQAGAEALADGVTQIAARSGYAMPKEEAAKIAASLTRMTPEQAQDAMRDLQISPRQASDTIDRPPSFPEPERMTPPDPDATRAILESPDHETALRADVDRARMTGDRQIPVDVDKDGEPVYASLDSRMADVDAYHKAADQIAACAAPVAEEAT